MEGSFNSGNMICFFFGVSLISRTFVMVVSMDSNLNGIWVDLAAFHGKQKGEK